MRVELVLSSNQPLILPVDHNHILQAFIYNNIEDTDYQKFLHNNGYRYENRRFRLFTFSRLQGKYSFRKETSEFIFESPVKLVVSSIVDKFVNEFVHTILQRKLYLGKNRIQVESVNISRREDIPEVVQARMLSPVVVYSTFQNELTKKTYFYAPTESEFSHLIRENLVKKHYLVSGETIEDPSFSIQTLYPIKQNSVKIIKYKSFVIKGWLTIFKISGDPKLLRVAYETGLGSKNSQGFGCFEIVN